MKKQEIPRKYRFLPNSKWTSVSVFKGWRHYMVVDFDFETQPFKVLIQAVCDQKILAWLEISELFNKNNWQPGWKRILQNPLNEKP